MADELFTIEEAAETLGMTKEEVVAKARERGWRSFRDGDLVKYLASDVGALKAELQGEGAMALEEETEETEETAPTVAPEVESTPVRGEETATEELIFEDTEDEFDVSLLEGEEEGAPEALAEMPELEDLELADETTETEVEDLASLIEEEEAGEPAVVEAAEEAAPAAVAAAAEPDLEGIEEVEEAAEEAGVIIPSRRIPVPQAAAEHPVFAVLMVVALLLMVYAGMFLINTVHGVNNALTSWTNVLAGGTD